MRRIARLWWVARDGKSSDPDEPSVYVFAKRVEDLSSRIIRLPVYRHPSTIYEDILRWESPDGPDLADFCCVEHLERIVGLKLKPGTGPVKVRFFVEIEE